MNDQDNGELFADDRASRREHSEISVREDGRVSARFNDGTAGNAKDAILDRFRDRREGLGGCTTDEGY